MQHLKIYNKNDVLSVTKLRRFETKLGERIKTVSNPAELEQSIAKHLGLPTAPAGKVSEPAAKSPKK